MLIDERQQSDALPSHLLPIHVDVKVGWVEVEDGGVVIYHEGLQGFRQVLSAVTGFSNEKRQGEIHSPSSWENA